MDRADAQIWIVQALASIGDLSAADREAILALPGTIRHVDADEDIVSEGEKPTAISVMVDGFACRYKILHDGRRQIVSFHIPGDMPDVQSLFIGHMDHSLGTLAPSTVLNIPHSAVIDLFTREPQVGRVFWRWTLIEASIFREWITNIGRRDAYSRVAHMLCEMVIRMRAVGLAQGDTCDLPLTQLELGDATGMSTVHVNRTLQALRRDRLIQFRGGALTVLDWGRLQEAGEFDPSYLHLQDPPVPGR